MSVLFCYVTDDRDKKRREVLTVQRGGNGDYYIGSRYEDERITHGVRICTSGGAARSNPALVKAVAELYRALGGDQQEAVAP